MKQVWRACRLAMFTALPVFGILTQFGCASPKAALHEIAIKEFQYLPASLSVRTGDTIIWKNQDIVPHTATSETAALSSGSIDPGRGWRYTAAKKGSYSYICAFHPTMVGMVEVH